MLSLSLKCETVLIDFLFVESYFQRRTAAIKKLISFLSC